MDRADHNLCKAILLMESHGLAPNVRSTSFASIKVWSKLYQAGPYFVDLTLAPGESDLNLRGELLAADDTLPPTDAEVTLYDEHGASTITQLNDGGFVLPLDQAGLYRLEVVYEDTLVIVEDLNIG